MRKKTVRSIFDVRICTWVSCLGNIKLSVGEPPGSTVAMTPGVARKLFRAGLQICEDMEAAQTPNVMKGPTSKSHDEA